MTRFLRILRDLHRYVFALTLGGSVVASCFLAACLFMIGLGTWPDAAATARITALMWIALSVQFTVVIVLFSWTSGRIDSFRFAGFGAEASVEFDDTPPSGSSSDELPPRPLDAP